MRSTCLLPRLVNDRHDDSGTPDLSVRLDERVMD